MSIQSLKLELVRQILDLDNETVVAKLMHTLQSEKKDFWDELSDTQKKEVELGLKQIERGETENWDDFLKRVS